MLARGSLAVCELCDTIDRCCLTLPESSIAEDRWELVWAIVHQLCIRLSKGRNSLMLCGRSTALHPAQQGHASTQLLRVIRECICQKNCCCRQCNVNLGRERKLPTHRLIERRAKHDQQLCHQGAACHVACHPDNRGRLEDTVQQPCHSRHGCMTGQGSGCSI